MEGAAPFLETAMAEAQQALQLKDYAVRKDSDNSDENVYAFIYKYYDIATLKSLGAQESLIRRIFVLEGWMISLAGLAAGLVIGIGFALIQQHFGFIKMPGQFTVQAYPIILSWADILLTSTGVAVIGYLIALLPVSLRR